MEGLSVETVNAIRSRDGADMHSDIDAIVDPGRTMLHWQVDSRRQLRPVPHSWI